MQHSISITIFHCQRPSKCWSAAKICQTANQNGRQLRQINSHSARRVQQMERHSRQNEGHFAFQTDI